MDDSVREALFACRPNSLDAIAEPVDPDVLTTYVVRSISKRAAPMQSLDTVP